MFIARNTKAIMMPKTAKIEITINNVMLTLDGIVMMVVRSTGGVVPPVLRIIGFINIKKFDFKIKVKKTIFNIKK